MDEFELNGNDYVALCDLLKIAGLTESGGAAKIHISQGEVKVDDQVETRKRCKIRDGQIVKFDGSEILVKA